MSYLSTVLADNPVHYWRCADAGGPILHDIGSFPKHMLGPNNLLGYTGIANDGGSFVAYQVQFYTVRENVPLTDPFSVEAWVWISEQTPGATYGIIEWDGVTAGTGVSMEIRTDRKVQCFVNASAAIVGTTILSTQTWHHLVVTYDRSSVRLYVDGVQDASLALTTATSANLHIGLGGKVNATAGVNFGFLCEGATYASALSAARVAAHYGAQETSQAPIARFALSGGTDSFGGVGTDLTAQILAAVVKTF